MVLLRGMSPIDAAHAQSLSSRTWVVNASHSQADDKGPGSADRPMRSVSAAAALAQPGDTVLIHAGVYREWVRPAAGGTAESPITYRTARPGSVVISGSDAENQRVAGVFNRRQTLHFHGLRSEQGPDVPAIDTQQSQFNVVGGDFTTAVKRRYWRWIQGSTCATFKFTATTGRQAFPIVRTRR